MNKPLGLHILIDRSGSMTDLAPTVVEETNRLLDQVRAAEPDARVTISVFDSQDPFEVLVDAVPVHRVRPLTERHYRPRAGTPLLDAVGSALAHASRAQRDRSESSQVVFAVVTDGQENASERFDLRAVAAKIARRRAAGWTLLYLGPGYALDDARLLGFRPDEVSPWEADVEGTRAAFATIAATALGPAAGAGSVDGFLQLLRRNGRGS